MTRRRAGSRWVIEHNDDGTVNVLCGGRPLRSNVPLSAARTLIRSKASPKDSVFSAAEDGYLTRVGPASARR